MERERGGGEKGERGKEREREREEKNRSDGDMNLLHKCTLKNQSYFSVLNYDRPINIS